MKIKQYSVHQQSDYQSAIDPNPDDEDLSDCDPAFYNEQNESYTYISTCPRCGDCSYVNFRFPYCMNCNWDSIHDPSWVKSDE